jgi:hypothetical protein
MASWRRPDRLVGPSPWRRHRGGNRARGRQRRLVNILNLTPCFLDEATLIRAAEICRRQEVQHDGREPDHFWITIAAGP